ncbi:hypothetical protein [Sulfolobus acidocaldarius]|nr:hypothetical protein [Sulfolobus acidocaldarius]AGE71296.1 hypothetical protein SacN8_06655 [Sulfolobus acidocaldarius N8]AGE73565.1 hypothetical protein SacRon12I_06645 [Sulfolobus acidocaldarius Ron12/I]ALU30445.1 hypothetical protein ATY89_11180 [Sulfolobus acidocaldarius]ALU31166.1 hypothetical protein ATZ20_02735 [Sulfolobus acidocaldarius]WCM36040.1 hypothetical protein GO597_07685 [Sulfolobus acidocaldarius DSM 639]
MANKYLIALGIIILVLVSIGVLFYTQNRDIVVYPEIYSFSLNYNTGNVTYVFYVNGVNNGLFSTTLNITLYVQAATLSQTNNVSHYVYKNYQKSVTLSLQSHSSEGAFVAVTIPVNYQITDVGIYGTGSFNYALQYKPNSTLASQLFAYEQLASRFQTPSSAYSTTTNASIKPIKGVAYGIQQSPVYFTYYVKNNTVIRVNYFFLNASLLKIQPGEYTVKVYANNTLINQTQITLNPKQISIVLFPLSYQSTSEKYDISVYLYNDSVTYYFYFEDLELG